MKVLSFVTAVTCRGVVEGSTACSSSSHSYCNNTDSPKDSVLQTITCLNSSVAIKLGTHETYSHGVHVCPVKPVSADWDTKQSEIVSKPDK
jgi:hypothetical protein